MKRLLVLMALLGLGGAIQAQTHFTVAYSGNPYLPMNIYVTGATIDGVALESGDEIGIFDGDLCVGVAVVDGLISPENMLPMVASTDDNTTPELDGFISGNSIGFRLWDENAGVEITAVDTQYVQGEGTFISQGTAAVSLTGMTNQTPVLADIADITFPEDSSVTIGLSATDPEEDPITFDAWTEESGISLTVTGDSVQVAPAANWNGSATIYASASDGFSSGVKSFTATVTPVNDIPELDRPVSDLVLVEDSPATVIALLDSVFIDVDDEPLTYTATSDTAAISVSIDGENQVVVTLEPDWYGTGHLAFSAQEASGTTVFDTAVVTVTPVNDPPVTVNPIPDFTLQEDPGDTVLADLDAVFRDVDTPELSYTADVSNAHLMVEVDAENLCILSTEIDWSGTGDVYLAATDGEYTAYDTVGITVISVNDGPSTPLLLFPLNGSELDTNGVVIWTFSFDVENDIVTGYRVQMASDPQFSDPEIDETITTQMVDLTVPPNVEQSRVSGTVDSVYALTLKTLTQYANLLDDVTYYWRVQSLADNGGVSAWQDELHSFFFNKVNTAPNPPVTGFNPQDSVTVSTLYPSFSWNTAVDPDRSDPAESLTYLLQVGDDWGFPDTLYEVATEPGQTSVTWEVGPVADNSVLFYRVKTVDDEGLESEWSSFWIFFINTKLDPPLEFLVLSPTTGDSLVVDSTEEFTEVTFTWNATTDPDLYDFVEYFVALDTSGAFEEITTIEELQKFTVVWPVGTDTSFSAPLDTGSYTWAVIAVDTDTLWQFGTDTSGNVLQHFTIWNPLVAVGDEHPVIDDYRLLQNYPNPFNPSTQIRYSLPKQRHVTVTVYDIRGHKITTLVNAEQQAGWHTVEWAGKNLLGQQVSAGIYFYCIQAGEFSDLKKMVLVK